MITAVYLQRMHVAVLHAGAYLTLEWARALLDTADAISVQLNAARPTR